VTWLLAALTLLFAACGGGHAAPARPAPAPLRHDAGVAAVGQPPSAAECDRLIAHAVDLGMAEQRAHRTPERVPTEEQLAKVRAQLHDGYAAACHALTREALACAMAATTLDTLAACDAPGASGDAAGAAGPQATPSSSTSNSSVAPGGMTPPAPRSP